jgi:hypothetical protein
VEVINLQQQKKGMQRRMQRWFRSFLLIGGTAGQKIRKACCAQPKNIPEHKTVIRTIDKLKCQKKENIHIAHTKNSAR